VNSTLLRLGAVAILVVAACGAPPVNTLPASVVDAPPRPYSGVAWIGEQLAVAYLGPVPGIVELERDGLEVADLTPPLSGDCGHREFMAVHGVDPGSFGFAQVCFNGPSAEFVQLDPSSGRTQSLGPATSIPFDAAWSPDGAITYSTGDVLCTTLNRLDGQDRPISVTVDIDGDQFEAGQDITHLPYGCPVGGRAGFPAVDGEGTLAFMASSDGDTPAGPGLLDRPWAVVVDEDGQGRTVLSGIKDPRDLAWRGDALIFAGEVDGRGGIWAVDLDGSNLKLLITADVLDFDIDAGGDVLVAIVTEGLGQDGEVPRTDQLITVDLTAEAPEQ
jgi:hypothetical protein